MTKILVIIRHAKTEAQGNGQRDFDRNLTDRGRNDAVTMGMRLKKLGLIPDLILSSSSSRTMQTSHLLAETSGYDPEAIQSSRELYHSSSEVIGQVLSDLPDTVTTCYLVAHNPGISQFAYDMQKDLFVGEMPTAAVMVIRVHSGSWQDLSRTKKEFLLFDYPKKQPET